MLTESSMTSPVPYPVKCFRDKKWVKIQTAALLHVDLMAMLFLLVSFLSLSPCQPKYRRVALVRNAHHVCHLEPASREAPRGGEGHITSDPHDAEGL